MSPSPGRSLGGDGRPGFTRCQVGNSGDLAELESPLGGRCCEQMHHASDDATPTRLVAGGQAGAVVAVEAFVNEDQIAPMRIFLKLLRSAVTATTFAAMPDLIAMLRRQSSAGMNPRMAAIMGVFQLLWV